MDKRLENVKSKMMEQLKEHVSDRIDELFNDADFEDYEKINEDLIITVNVADSSLDFVGFNFENKCFYFEKRDVELLVGGFKYDDKDLK